MLGTVRFILAFFVFISHFPQNGLKINLGVVSVILFYFISGFLMEKSYLRFLEYSKNPAIEFYIDRFLKLFPQYLIILILTIISIRHFGNSELITLFNQKITVDKIFINTILVLNNYIFEPFSINALIPHPIVPPTWSLSTEIHFYLLRPLIFYLHKKVALILFISLIIQFSSFFFSDGNFNSNNFGYRYIFGVLTVFIYGYSFSRRKDQFFRTLSKFIWINFSVFLFIVLPAFNLWRNPLVQEVIIGGFIALPLGYALVYLKLESNFFRKLDILLGSLAYPIFISHFLAIYLVEKLSSIKIISPLFYMLSVTLCFIISFFLHFFQLYIEKFRTKKRGFESLREKELG